MVVEDTRERKRGRRETQRERERQRGLDLTDSGEFPRQDARWPCGRVTLFRVTLYTSIFMITRLFPISGSRDSFLCGERERERERERVYCWCASCVSSWTICCCIDPILDGPSAGGLGFRPDRRPRNSVETACLTVPCPLICWL